MEIFDILVLVMDELLQILDRLIATSFSGLYCH